MNEVVKIRLAKMSKNEIEIRDNRGLFYMVDTEFMFKWVKICGVYASIVYQALCSHANHGRCYPSIVGIACRLGISRSTVIRGVKRLEEHRLVEVDRVFGQRSIYTLTKKNQWRRHKILYYKTGNMRRATKKEMSGVVVSK